MIAIRSGVGKWCFAGLAGFGVLSVSGCDGGPDNGSRQQATAQEVEQRGQGIKNAMKSGAYDVPKPPPATK